MRGEELDAATIGWHGVDGDRRYAFVKSDSPSGFPWLTAREVHIMVRYMARFADPADISSPLEVTTPEGRTLPLNDPLLLAELSAHYDGPVHLMHLRKGCQDTSPVSMIGTATLAELGRRVGLELSPRRFRPNILVEVDAPFGEEGWLGHTLTFGSRADSARIRADRQNVRCVLTTVDPDTAERSPQVLKTIAQERNECAGIYLSPVQPGTIQVGDPIYLA
jgi:hypothetical protein